MGGRRLRNQQHTHGMKRCCLLAGSGHRGAFGLGQRPGQLSPNGIEFTMGSSFRDVFGYIIRCNLGDVLRIQTGNYTTHLG